MILLVLKEILKVLKEVIQIKAEIVQNFKDHLGIKLEIL